MQSEKIVQFQAFGIVFILFLVSAPRLTQSLLEMCTVHLQKHIKMRLTVMFRTLETPLLTLHSASKCSVTSL